MAANISGLHQFANDIGPLPLKLLDDSYSTLSIALNTLQTFSNFYSDTGTTNHYTVNTTQFQFVSYTDGLKVLVRLANTSTGASTLNVNGLGAMPILNPNGAELDAGALQAGGLYEFVYNAQRQAWQLPATASSLTTPFMVTNASGQPVIQARNDGFVGITSWPTGNALDLEADGSGALGCPPCQLTWDANCNWNFTGNNSKLGGLHAPFTISGPNNEPLLSVANPVSGSGDCLVTLGPGSAGAIQSGPVLCLDGMTNYPVLQVWGATHTQPDIYLANYVASCATPGLSNGVWIAAGTNDSDHAFIVENCASVSDPPNKQQFFALNGDGSGTLGPEPNQLKWDSAGNFTFTGSATFPGIGAPLPQAFKTLTDVDLASPVWGDYGPQPYTPTNSLMPFVYYGGWMRQSSVLACPFELSGPSGPRFGVGPDGSGRLGPHLVDTGTSNLLSGVLNWDANGAFQFIGPIAGGLGAVLNVAGYAGQVAFSVHWYNNPNQLDYPVWIENHTPQGLAGTCNGPRIQAGWQSGDHALRVVSNKVNPDTSNVELFQVEGDGQIFMPTIPSTTSSLGDTLGLSAAMSVYRVVSSARYKTDIHTVARERARDIVRKLRAVTFRSLCEHDDPDQENFGLIAEEVAAIEPRLATYDRDGNPSGVQYSQVLLMLLPLMQELLEESHG